MTDTPEQDVREIAKERVELWLSSRAATSWAFSAGELADAVLAVVTPVIRRQVAEEIADSIHAHDERYGGRATRYAIGHSDALQTAAAIARSHSQYTGTEETNRGAA